MTHYKSLLDPAKFLGPADFPVEKEKTISRVVREKLPERDGDKGPAQFAPMLYFLDNTGKEYPRPMKLPKLLMHGLSLMHGPEIESWVGKKVTVFAARCLAFGDVEDCLRFRFPAAIDDGIRKFMRKRKVNPQAYIMRDQSA